MHCCARCHFASEEQAVLPHLHPVEAAWLEREHAELRQAGYPVDRVLEHAAREMIIFERRCPRDIVAQIADEHERYRARALGEA